MVTRSKVQIVKLNQKFSFHVSAPSHIPRSHIYALCDPHWQHAMLDEYNALISNDGSLSKYKAHLISNGRNQQQGYIRALERRDVELGRNLMENEEKCMTRRSNSKLFTLFTDPERQFHTRRDLTPSYLHNIFSFYESDTSETETEQMGEVDIDTLTMEPYMALTSGNNGVGVVSKYYGSSSSSYSSFSTSSPDSSLSLSTSFTPFVSSRALLSRSSQFISRDLPSPITVSDLLNSPPTFSSISTIAL
ncbi:hypothetical protein Tco_1547628 [Tanacetum coccineum]